MLPISVAAFSTFFCPGICLILSKMSFNSGSTAVTSFPATLAFSILSTSLERPTYSGSRLDSIRKESLLRISER